MAASATSNLPGEAPVPKGSATAPATAETDSLKRDIGLLKARGMNSLIGEREEQRRLTQRDPIASNFLELSALNIAIAELSEGNADEQMRSLDGAIRAAEAAVMVSHTKEEAERSVFNQKIAEELIGMISKNRSGAAAPAQQAMVQNLPAPEAEDYLKTLTDYLDLEENKGTRAKVQQNAMFNDVAYMHSAEGILELYRFVFLDWYNSTPVAASTQFGFTIQDIINARTSEEFLQLNTKAWRYDMKQRASAGKLDSQEYLGILSAEELGIIRAFAQGEDASVLYISKVMYRLQEELAKKNSSVTRLPPPPPPPISRGVTPQQKPQGAQTLEQSAVPEWSEENEPAAEIKVPPYVTSTAPGGVAQKSQSTQGIDQMTLEQVEKEIQGIRNKYPQLSDLAASPADADRMQALIVKRNQLKPQQGQEQQ